MSLARDVVIAPCRFHASWHVASSAKPNEVHREGWVIFIQRGAALRGGDKDKARWRIAVNVARYLVLSWQQKAPVAKAAGA
jgi:hypothetical protein